jgi:predicted methyltransferase
MGMRASPRITGGSGTGIAPNDWPTRSPATIRGTSEMDRNMFAALKSGGFLVIADHSALPGQGTSVGKTLHRIEESTLRKEVEAAGFRVIAEGNFWRHPEDTHDFPSFRPTMPVDEFVLKFQKPM